MPTIDLDDIRTGPARTVPAAALVDAVATLYAASDRLREFIGDESPLGHQLEKAAERLVAAAYDERPEELWEALYAAGREQHSTMQAAIEAAHG